MAQDDRPEVRRKRSGTRQADGCGSFGRTLFIGASLGGYQAGVPRHPGMISPVGVMYDYFSAASDESAATTIDLPGGPDGAGALLPMPVPEIVRRYGRDGLRELLRPRLRLAETGFHVVATKGFDSTTDLGAIEGILTGVDFDEFLARPRTSHVVAERDGGERLVLTISDELQGVLATVEAAELTAAARRWVEEQGSGDTDVLGGLLHELAELARGAQRRGERLYCWICV